MEGDILKRQLQCALTQLGEGGGGVGQLSPRGFKAVSESLKLLECICMNTSTQVLYTDWLSLVLYLWLTVCAFSVFTVKKYFKNVNA